MTGQATRAAALPPQIGMGQPGALPQAGFDDLYSAVYRILDDAKASHRLVKLYKGSHASPVPHQHVLRFGEFFYRTRQGLLAYACSAASSAAAAIAALDAYDREHHPRISVRAVFGLLAATSRRPGESHAAFLRYLATRTHDLGAYRGGSSGYDDEAKTVAAAHFQGLSVPAAPANTLVICGGAKGAFLAFCAALMCRRNHDDLSHEGGLLLAPEGYYQSLRLIPAIFGGDIHVVPNLTEQAIAAWLDQTAHTRNRAIYVPLVNNANGRVLTWPRACQIARAILRHNHAHPGRAVYVLADDVYAGSYLTPGLTGMPVAAIDGAALGQPTLGPMSDWTLTVVTPSKTFALPTSRVAFATTTSQTLLEAVAHYRTVFSLGRVPQAMELTAAAALCLTPPTWAAEWNHHYRRTFSELAERIAAINSQLGFGAFTAQPPEGGWYLPLRISPALFPTRLTSSLDTYAVLLHYGRDRRGSGIGMLPGELFGHRSHQEGFLLRATLAASSTDLDLFIHRLAEAAALLRGPDGPAVVDHALRRARTVADVDEILARCRY
jgi:aspartate/methionine/tyrosine aminotransferase